MMTKHTSWMRKGLDEGARECLIHSSRLWIVLKSFCKFCWWSCISLGYVRKAWEFMWNNWEMIGYLSKLAVQLLEMSKNLWNPLEFWTENAWKCLISTGNNRSEAGWWLNTPAECAKVLVRVPGNAWFTREDFELYWNLFANFPDEAV